VGCRLWDTRSELWVYDGVVRFLILHFAMWNKKLKIEIAALPSVARAPQDDVVILRKCPWGAMTSKRRFRTFEI
jgi:hypothetical protein